MRYQTLIFDLDGTISDPSEGITNCVNQGLVACGFPAAKPADIRRLIGPPLTEIFAALTGCTDEKLTLKFVAAYRDRYAGSGYRENVIYPEMPGVIETIAGAGARMGICTSKRADYATKIVDMFGLLAFFEFVDGGDIYIRKATQLENLVAGGLDPSSTIMIGDRAVDIEAARHNAIASAGVCWGFGERKEIEEARPDYIAESPNELLEMFG